MKPAAELEIRPLGDSAIIVEIGERDSTSSTVVDEVLRAQHLLEQTGIRGVTEITTAFSSVALFYDPVLVGERGATLFSSMEAQIRSALGSESQSRDAAEAEPRTIDVPVCYGPELGLDLADVAAHTGLSVDDVVRLHSSAEYRVACIGFTPGFPYLIGLPAELATPRRATPRTAVPAGSVAIGGSHTGIYPTQSPGGWHVIGRTSLRLFDAAREPLSLLRAGDRVRLHEISRAEFEAQASANK